MYYELILLLDQNIDCFYTIVTLQRQADRINMNDGKLGLMECVNILIGGMIGSAIFSLSGLTMFSAGPSAMLSWLIAGVVMMLYGMLVCELACRYPQSGGVYVFPRKAFGDKNGKLWAWLSCWGSILTNIVAIAFGAIYVGIYLGVAFPIANDHQILLALIAIAISFVANIIKFTIAGKINNVVVGLLIVTILTYVFAALFNENFETANFLPFFSQGANGNAAFLSAVPIAIIGYSSINAMAFVVAEVKKPETTVSKSILIAISVVIVVYCLVIFSTMGLITAKFLADNPAMRFIPLFAACFNKLQNIPWLSGIVSFSATIALLTTMLVCVTMNSRNIQAAAEDGNLPMLFAKNNKNGVPAFAAGVTCFLAAIIACFPQLTNIIVNFGAVFNVFTIIITITALIAARKNTEQKPAFVAPGGRAMPAIVLIILVLCNISSIVSGGFNIWLYTIISFILGIAIYYLMKAHKSANEE